MLKASRLKYAKNSLLKGMYHSECANMMVLLLIIPSTILESRVGLYHNPAVFSILMQMQCTVCTHITSEFKYPVVNCHEEWFLRLYGQINLLIMFVHFIAYDYFLSILNPKLMRYYMNIRQCWLHAMTSSLVHAVWIVIHLEDKGSTTTHRLRSSAC